MPKLFPYIELGDEAAEPIVFLAGFPDDQLSAFGPLIDKLKSNHRILTLCFPDFDIKHGSQQLKPRPWGYDFAELDKMLDDTIVAVLGKEQKFTMVIHDWGCFVGLKYQNNHPERVSRLVMIDVGIKNQLSLYDIIVILFYQFWFAGCYIVSQIFNETLGNALFVLLRVIIATFPFLSFLFVIPSGGVLAVRTVSEVGVHMCYPYYQFWKAKLTMNPSVNLKYPKCPLLYLYGKKKNVMFHDKKFLEKISSSQLSRHVGFDAGHWVMVEQTEGVLKEMELFFSETN